MHATIPARRAHATGSRFTRRAARALRVTTLAGLLLAGGLVGGCASALPPTAEVTGVRQVASTGEGAQVVFELAASNPNAEPVRLDAVRYEVWAGSTRVFQGERAAQTTLPGYATRMILLPAGLPSQGGVAGVGGIGGTLRISGEIEYRPPGVFRRTMEDAGWSPLRASFGGEGTTRAE